MEGAGLAVGSVQVRYTHMLGSDGLCAWRALCGDGLLSGRCLPCCVGPKTFTQHKGAVAHTSLTKKHSLAPGLSPSDFTLPLKFSSFPSIYPHFPLPTFLLFYSDSDSMFFTPLLKMVQERPKDILRRQTTPLVVTKREF